MLKLNKQTHNCCSSHHHAQPHKGGYPNLNVDEVQTDRYCRGGDHHDVEELVQEDLDLVGVAGEHVHDLTCGRHLRIGRNKTKLWE